MNNLSVSWDYTKFKSKEDAQKFCLSEDCLKTISNLEATAESLRDKAKFEVPVQAGHGYPLEAPSSLEASYCQEEANRLKTLRRYFMGEAPKPGYVWKYSEHGLHSVFQTIDTRNLCKEHPVFLDYCKQSKKELSEKDKEKAFEVWSAALKDTGSGVSNISKLFAMAYHFKIEELIPDNVKLLKIGK